MGKIGKIANDPLQIGMTTKRTAPLPLRVKSPTAKTEAKGEIPEGRGFLKSAEDEG